MTRPIRALILVAAGLLLNIPPAHSQSAKKSLAPDAPLPQTLDWLKSHIPYNYVQPAKAGRFTVERESIGGVRTKGCRLSYEVTKETVTNDQPSFAADPPRQQNWVRQRWEVDLAGLNPRLIAVTFATESRPTQVEFTSFNPADIQRAQASGTSIVLPASAIWRSVRQGAKKLGEGFEMRGTLSAGDLVKARDLATALQHAVELCQQLYPERSNTRPRRSGEP